MTKNNNVLYRSVETFLKMKQLATQRGYRWAITDFCKFAGFDYHGPLFEVNIKRVSADDALEYLVDLKDRPGQLGSLFADASVKHRYHALRSIFGHLVRFEHLKKNVFEQAAGAISMRQRHQKRPTRGVPFGNVMSVINAPDTRTPKGISDKALITTLFAVGLRRGEALNLRIGDIGVTPAGNIFVRLNHTKGGTVQERAVPKWAWPSLSALVSQRKAYGATNADPLFVFYYTNGAQRGKISESTLYRLFVHYCLTAGISATPHSARATAASMLKHLGKEDRDVQAVLGHSGIGMVQVYDKRTRGVDNSAALDLVYKG